MVCALCISFLLLNNDSSTYSNINFHKSGNMLSRAQLHTPQEIGMLVWNSPLSLLYFVNQAIGL